MVNTNKIINSKIIKTNNVFDDILLPLNKRNGFIKSNPPIVPTYFYRYIGITKNQDEYYNNLYKLDKNLSDLNNLYLKFISNIPFNTDYELIKKTANLWGNLDPFNDKKKIFLLSSIKLVKALPLFPNELTQTSINEAFNYIFNLYIKNTQNINATKIKNFTLKILTWINKFIPNLFQNVDYNKNETNDIFNPKIIYYGNIKNHEIYFLIFLSKIGCDILYINSYSDGAFLEIDKENTYSNIIELNTKSPLKDFPKREVISRTETIAFKASNEIEEIIYDEESGLYKPWQFESYNVEPVTLKTTYDELKILWNEEARMRTGFKIENGTIYIPNIFAKISGVTEDINIYWKDLSYFKLIGANLFISNLPFTEINYSKHDLYRLSYLINNDGYLHEDSLIKSEFYKFSYLKTSLQKTIIKKINDMFELPLFKKEVNKEFKLKILMTILNIDKNLIELLQSFDYPFKIPKLIIYSKDENSFSDEDSIIITFLNLIGFDILIITPTGYNNIENQIPRKYYDIHKFEKINLNLELANLDNINKKKFSFLSKLFKI
ncbi:tellurium resistance protein [Clostridium tetani]|uniref:Tellurium resistance protein n=1 Tax=Clostridium tetani TaxID=1513 RepID=A0ABY0ETH2_CLOTA|nr:YceG family protein [Clostridium tetani]KHO33660.1 tellurium resistance protein [Clostridium tetani]RXI56387.1 tellurium resistance protein [Clostridium tetani]RXI71213.1 tellurium resistance protein [Clostridium tetani]